MLYFVLCIVTWCRLRPCKAARESCTHVLVRSRKYFLPASLPCRPYKLWPAAAAARAVAVSAVRLLRLAVATTATRRQRAVATAAADELQQIGRDR